MSSSNNNGPDHIRSGDPAVATRFLPALGADPGRAPYELLTAPQAAERIAAVGFTPEDAKLMVSRYLAANVARYGMPETGWRLDRTLDMAQVRVVLIGIADERNGGR